MRNLGGFRKNEFTHQGDVRALLLDAVDVAVTAAVVGRTVVFAQPDGGATLFWCDLEGTGQSGYFEELSYSSRPYGLVSSRRVGHVVGIELRRSVSPSSQMRLLRALTVIPFLFPFADRNVVGSTAPNVNMCAESEIPATL